MATELKDLFDLFSVFGKWGAPIALLLYVCFVIMRSKLFAATFGKIVDWVLSLLGKKLTERPKDTDEKLTKKSDFSNHEVFSHIDYWVNNRIPTIRYKSDYRTMVFRKYLTILLRHYKISLQKLVSDKSTKEMDGDMLWKTILDMLNDTIFSYEREMEGVGIPKTVIESMKAKNNLTLVLTFSLLETVCVSKLYDSENNHLKMYAVLNTMMSILDHSISLSEMVCSEINGALSGCRYTDPGTGETFIEP